MEQLRNKQNENEKIRLPYYNNGPVGNYYRNIKWKNGFENWDLIRIDTVADGSCLFHAIANGYFVPYSTGILNDDKITKREIVQKMRKELSEKLSSRISDDPNSKTHYEIINSGKTAEFPVYSELPDCDFSLNNMIKQLNSDEYIGYGYIEYISNALEKNIYILHQSDKDIYPFEKNELMNLYKKNRPSIVVYYIPPNSESIGIPEHYELVGVMNNGIIDTYFDSDHTFIKFLYNRVLQKINTK